MPIFEHKDELLILGSDAERRKALAEVEGRVQSHGRWRWTLAFGVAGSTGWTVSAITRNMFLRTSVVPEWVTGLSITCAVAGSIVWLFEWLSRKRAQTELRKYLLERGFLVCQRCGYDLRGQTEPRCPECGRQFDPNLIGQRPALVVTEAGPKDASR